MLINDFQGVCSLPSPIDDEFITSQGMFPQPTHRTSILSGFVIVSQLFRILSECFFHHRCVATGFKGIGINWTIEAEERLHRVLKDMPLAIQDPEGHGGGLGPVGLGLGGQGGLNGQALGGGGDGGKAVFAMQRANVLITAAITKFALVSLTGHKRGCAAHESPTCAPRSTSRRTSWPRSARLSRARCTCCS
jgi:hypothetical protein